jgi:hypothetical protein
MRMVTHEEGEKFCPRAGVPLEGSPARSRSWHASCCISAEMIPDDDDELELRAFRDALRDIFASDGRVELAFPELPPGEADPARAPESN